MPVSNEEYRRRIVKVLRRGAVLERERNAKRQAAIMDDIHAELERILMAETCQRSGLTRQA